MTVSLKNLPAFAMVGPKTTLHPPTLFSSNILETYHTAKRQLTSVFALIIEIKRRTHIVFVSMSAATLLISKESLTLPMLISPPLNFSSTVSYPLLEPLISALT